MKNKNIISTVSAVFFLIALFSCSDFLKEELTTSRNTDYYKTDEGVIALSAAAYSQVFCTPFNSEAMYCHTNYGTDEFKVGGDGSNGAWNNYDGTLKSVVTPVNANTLAANALWDNMYVGTGYANLLIKSVQDLASTNEQVSKTCLGEGYFLRAYNYQRLVNQYGGVPLKLEPSATVEREFTRASAQEVMNQVVEDFRQAYNLLPASASAPGKLTRYAAAHFLAKALITRASEIHDAWNGSTRSQDLQEAVKLCDEVIAHHPLAGNFSELWAYVAPNGPNENLSEIILAAQFSSENAVGTGNSHHLFFASRYEDIAYMQRDLTGGRPYSRLGTTYYMYRIYDMQRDSRFWKSFKTKSRLNNASGDYYRNGDLGIMYVINQPGDDRFEAAKLNDKVIYSKTGKTIPHVYVAYPNGSTEDGALYADVRFPSCSKHLDASRLTFNETKGFRDVVLARSAETYLLAAEAEVRLGDYAKALTYINPVRQRATYKEGENREVYVDGGAAYPSSPLNQDPDINSYMPENSYYESNNIPETTAATDLTVSDPARLPAQDEWIIAKLGLSRDYDRMLCFVLNERARELAGEFMRWEDLSRTKTLIPRARAFNPEAAVNIQEYHALRPIPQTYLDGIQKDGKALTADEKQAQQNSGY
ncbi:MAG: RagB/SusD family nutrient uptake outer membrane protein [Tannerella sp.]|jgi:hypothetical protein|nr:RagB/SusD family nutrient uptake outer membrane protein [Tannerella sp.]